MAWNRISTYFPAASAADPSDQSQGAFAAIKLPWPLAFFASPLLAIYEAARRQAYHDHMLDRLFNADYYEERG